MQVRIIKTQFTPNLTTLRDQAAEVILTRLPTIMEYSSFYANEVVASDNAILTRIVNLVKRITSLVFVLYSCQHWGHLMITTDFSQDGTELHFSKHHPN